MNFKKYLQNLFKKKTQNLFSLLYGKIAIHNEQKSRKFKRHKVEKITINNINFFLNTNIYEIEKGRVYTDIVEHVAIIKDNLLLPKASYQQIDGELKSIDFNKVLDTGTPRLIKKVDGTMLSLVQGVSGENYFHFLFDLLTKLKLCDQIIPLNEIDYYYVPGNIDWQKKIFLHFGIKESQLIDSKIHRHIKAKKLIALDHPWYHKGYVQDEIENFPEWIVYWLREKFLDMKKKFGCSDKIFIDRSESKFKHCQFQNNNEIINFLNSKGFTSYKIGKLDFLEQVYLFNNAKIIIGPHGAAFTNIVFCRPKTNVIEILPSTRKSLKCEKISNILSLNYSRIIVESLKENKFGDMNFEIKKMNDVIESISH
jgi:capsular polysaccharide biosynthesis protein